MHFLKTIISESNWFLSIITILSGIAVVIMAFFNEPLQLQIALGFIGLGIISIGLVQIKRSQDSKKTEQILFELNEIQQELRKPKEPKTGHTAIADVITAGLQYYAGHMTKHTKQDDEEE
ncbi:hypothetical protein ACFLUO_03450 [Chloroflexota bacterium]